jgi:hypothetical protein
MCPHSSDSLNCKPRVQGPLAPVVYHPHFRLASTCLLLAGVVIPIEATLGGLHGHTTREKFIAQATIIAFMILAGAGVRMLAVQCGRAGA